MIFRHFLDCEPWTTLLLAAILAGILALCAYAILKNPQLNPKPVVPSSERMGP